MEIEQKSVRKLTSSLDLMKWANKGRTKFPRVARKSRFRVSGGWPDIDFKSGNAYGGAPDVYDVDMPGEYAKRYLPGLNRKTPSKIRQVAGAGAKAIAFPAALIAAGALAKPVSQYLRRRTKRKKERSKNPFDSM